MSRTVTGEMTVQATAWGRRDRRGRGRGRVPALTLLFHPDARRVGEQARLTALLDGEEAELSRLAPGFAPPGLPAVRSLDDLHVSRSPIRLAPLDSAGEPGGVRLIAAGSRTRLAADGMPVAETRDLSAREVERGVVLELADRIVLLLHMAGTPATRSGERFGLVGDSEAIERVRGEIAAVADLGVPVLLRGETGTGKELAAEAIHRASRRRSGEFLSLNMGAVPPALAASELFGAVKGAFTGSVRTQIGYFQRAHGGTLFLDEIGEAPPEVQVMLLRVLETGEIHRVGSQEPQRVDVRLIAATDADLEEAIRQGRFRAPLLHRLSGYEIALPPLRERRDDFGRLLFHFLRQELRGVGEEQRLEVTDPAAAPWLPASIVARLARHDWPGNVRQLRNVARQLAIDSRGAGAVRVGPQVERLLREAAPGAAHPPAPPSTATDSGGRRALPRPYREPGDVSRDELLAALRANRWELKATAAQLGISRPSLYLLIDKHPGIRKAADLARAEILECREQCDGDLDAMAERLEVSRRGLQQRIQQLGL